MDLKLVAVDLGASGGRVLTGILSGGKNGLGLELTEAHRFDNLPVYIPHDTGRTLHWDAPSLWREILTGVRSSVGRHGRPASIGVDTWGVDYALLDEHGRLVELPIAYRDARTTGVLPSAFARVPRAEIFARTGLQFMELNTLFQLFAATRDDPGSLRRAQCLLLMPDLFHYWLCGSRTIEATNASTTQFVSATEGGWDRDLLRRMAVPDHFLPEIVPAATDCGPLRPSVADETGCGDGVRIICPPTHDTASAVVATPGQGSDWAFLSTGTWCLFGAEVAQPYLDPSVLDAGFSNEGGVRGTTRLLRNITGLWLVQECRRYWRERGDEFTWAQLAALAEGAQPHVACIDPDDAAFAHPGPMPDRIVEYCRRSGQTVPNGAGEIVRTALEGIALTVRRRWDELQSILGRRLRVLHMVGGGTQNRLLCRLVAEAIRAPVIVGPTEATAMGNILGQAVGLELIDFAEARLVVRRSCELLQYDPAGGSGWDDAYARFRTVTG